MARESSATLKVGLLLGEGSGEQDDDRDERGDTAAEEEEEEESGRTEEGMRKTDSQERDLSWGESLSLWCGRAGRGGDTSSAREEEDDDDEEEDEDEDDDAEGAGPALVLVAREAMERRQSAKSEAQVAKCGDEASIEERFCAI